VQVEDIGRELQKVVSSYSREFVGRERTLRLILLALITKQHIYMISPPGTGKTMMERVARSFGMTVFYYLYNYDVKLEDVVYDVVIRKVPVDGGGEKIVVEYELKNPGLGTCDIHFADEMFKAPTAVLNALLGAMNERRLTLGNREYNIPLWTLIAASNELPERAEAVVDRFLFRDFLKYLEKELWQDYLIRYWVMRQPGYQKVRVTVPRRVLEEAHSLVPSVDVYGVLGDYVKLLEKLHDRNIIVSDRRKGRILQAVAASAILAGRDVAEPEDLEVLLYTVPRSEDELDVVAKVVDEHLGGLLKVKAELDSIKNQLVAFLGVLPNKSTDEIIQFATRDLPTIRSKILMYNVPSLSRRVEEISRLAEDAENQVVDVLARRAMEEVAL